MILSTIVVDVFLIYTPHFTKRGGGAPQLISFRSCHYIEITLYKQSCPVM